jgi:hypothetical protein
MFFPLDPRRIPDHTSHVGWNKSIHSEEVLTTKDRLAWLSPWVTSFFLSHDRLGVGEKDFSQVITQLHQLTESICQHAISAFNTCSRRITHRSLTDIDGGYNLEGVGFPHHTLWPSQPTVLHFPLVAPSDLRLTSQHKSNLKSRYEVVTYISWVVSIPLGFYRILWLRLARLTTYNYDSNSKQG